ncbi:F0F1 ATP synthase subunit C [Gracilibacillus sp. YIM 98692]|uniref:F0F1 ATP synthase subunit C n=1 Tax=Gracilibacillus sp. YIM 98692 TaxID=2663532 RepID=UPI0013D059A9|nr:F0F1 ATP synthase subunit C [Gracilibacillus sp. YIM 98692]
MAAAWIFTIASVIAGIGILFAFKRLMRGLSYRIKRNEFNQQGLQKDQTRYFIQVALIEAIPIFLVVLGFTFMEEETIQVTSAIIPILIILAVIAYSSAQIWMTKQELMSEVDELSKTEKGYVNSLSFIGFVTILTIPLLSIVVITII